MKYQELKPDIELGQDLKPEIMPIGLFLSKNLLQQVIKSQDITLKSL